MLKNKKNMTKKKNSGPINKAKISVKTKKNYWNQCVVRKK